MNTFDRRVRLFLVLAVVLLFLVGVAAAIPGQRSLVVERVDTGDRIVETPVSNGTVVGLEYTHSVEKTRVYDEYTVRGDRLVNTRMEFESYGWGLPAEANVTRENGTFVYDPPGELRRLTVKPGTVANHTLIVGEDRYDLVRLSAGESVHIHVEQESVLTDWLGGLV